MKSSPLNNDRIRHYSKVSLAFACLLTGCTAPTTPKTTPANTVATTPSVPNSAGTSPAPPQGGTSTGSSNTSGTQAAPLPGNMTADFSLAKTQVENTIALQPKEHNLRMRAAEFYMQTGHYAEAIPHLKAATKLDPTKVLAWIALGDAAAFANQFALAEEAYATAAKKDANNPFVARGRGQMLVMQKKFSQAQKVLQQGLKANPQDIEISTALGNLYLIVGKPHEATKVLAPIVAKVSNRPDLNYMIGEAYERDLHVEAAILQMKEVVRMEPNNAMAWGRLGLYHNNLTRYLEARKALQRAIALNSNESYFFWALGDSYLLENVSDANFAQAKENYKKALELDPKNDKALYSYGMGLTRRSNKEDWAEAIPLFERLIALRPTDMNAHYKLYETYRRLGRTQEAEAHRAKFKDLFAKGRTQTRDRYAAASFRDTAEVHLKLGNKAMQEKNYALAAIEFQMALERDRNLDAARKGMLEAQKKQNLGAKATAP